MARTYFDCKARVKFCYRRRIELNDASIKIGPIIYGRTEALSTKIGLSIVTVTGVLFLDELPEFRRNVLEVMRQPLEDGSITVSRAMGSMNYPASFMLVAAMNPCVCGFLTDPQKECTCTPLQIQRYRSKVSGPLLDRIDIQVEVPGLRYQELASKDAGESL